MADPAPPPQDDPHFIKRRGILDHIGRIIVPRSTRPRRITLECDAAATVEIGPEGFILLRSTEGAGYTVTEFYDD